MKPEEEENTWRNQPFWVKWALSAADLGFLLKVKFFEGGGWGPNELVSAVLFKYELSRGRALHGTWESFTESKKIYLLSRIKGSS